MGGYFSSIGGQARDFIARFNADGTLDTAFDPSANNYVYSIAVHADGKILVGGEFTNIGGETRNYIARLSADAAALQSLTFSENGATIRWMRGQSSPELYDVTFEYSSDMSSWTYLGSGTRIAGGWELTGQLLPLFEISYIRALGKSLFDESTSIMESVRLFYNKNGYILDSFDDSNYTNLWDVSSSGIVTMTLKKSALNVVIKKPLSDCSYANLTSKQTFSGENLLFETGVRLKGYGEMILRLKKDDNNYVQFGITGVVDKIPSFIMGSSEDGTYTEQPLNLSVEYKVKKKYKYKTFSIVKIGDEYRAYLNGMETGGMVTNPLLGDEGLKVVLLNGVCSTDRKDAKNYFDYVFVSETIDGSIPSNPLTLLTPNGGETITRGSVSLVLWEGPAGADYYSIEHSKDSGVKKWKRLDTGLESKFYTWKLRKAKPYSTYKLRVNAHDSLGNIIDSDASDSNFTIQY